MTINFEDVSSQTAQTIHRILLMGSCELAGKIDLRSYNQLETYHMQKNGSQKEKSCNLSKITRSEFIEKSKISHDSLISPKDLFLSTHTPSGVNWGFERLSLKDQNIIKDCNIGFSDGMSFSLENEMPQLSAYNKTTDFVMIPYDKRKRHSGHGEAVHFFIRDSLFSDSIWKNLERTTYSLRKFDVLFAPDYSLYADAPSKMLTLWNIYRSRFVALYWQLNGYDVIPTASWGNADSLRFCFEGLPTQSVIAVCGIGHSFCSPAKRLWNYAVDKLIEEKQPSTLIVYGGDRREAEAHGPNVKYFEDIIKTYFRN